MPSDPGTFQPLAPAAIAERFGLETPQAARAFMRRYLPHWEVGSHIYTSEEKLLRWAAAHVKNPLPPRPTSRSPGNNELEQQAEDRALYRLEALCARGVKIQGERYRLVIEREGREPAPNPQSEILNRQSEDAA